VKTIEAMQTHPLLLRVALIRERQRERKLLRMVVVLLLIKITDMTQ
jgi:hypothetical protein